MIVEYHPAIEAELKAIESYYENRSPGLGQQFIDEFERQVLALAAKPERWMVVQEDVRRCLMRRFPYIIYFRRIGVEKVRITVVNDGIRNMAVSESRPNEATGANAGGAACTPIWKPWAARITQFSR